MIGLRSWHRGETEPAADKAAPTLPADGLTTTSSEPTQPKPADVIFDQVLAQIEPALAARLDRSELAARVEQLVIEIANQRGITLSPPEQPGVVAAIVDDIIGLGPVEPLLRDDTVSDILVNGPYRIYIERRGKLELTGLQFRNDRHVLYVAQRIAASLGRQIDKSNLILDARLPDGSRVNVVIPPLCLQGPSISIRKFSRILFGFPQMIELKSMSPELAKALEIAAHCRLNILISGGTGSGKTTLLNAMAGYIDSRERIVTIEEIAELQLRQPNLLSLETQPADAEGRGALAQRDLVRNALRMRPDRIIVGEVRGPEAFDMMQAMNTGHNGSMSTIHANSARDALTRLENMIMLANVNLPSRGVRAQIVSALDLVVQIERMRDGVRRIMEVTEVVGMEGEVITLTDLFEFQYEGENHDGSLRGSFVGNGIQPRFLKRLEFYGLAAEFLKAIRPGKVNAVA